MTTMRRLSIILVLLGVCAGVAAAQEPPAPAPAPAAANPLAGVSLDKYRLNADKNDALQVGRAFLDDLKKASPDAWASVTEAIRYDLQTGETERFARQKNYVLYAYAALWVILLVFVVGVFARQRHLAAELAELERRVSVERK